MLEVESHFNKGNVVKGFVVVVVLTLPLVSSCSEEPVERVKNQKQRV
jgi:hypothetical protein